MWNIKGRNRSAHRVPTLAEIETEVARMKSLNVAVLQRGPMGDDGSRYVLFDTRPEGKYTLGIYYQPQSAGSAPPDAKHVTQFAFIVRDDAAVSKYWSKLGWPEMIITHPDLSALEYRGKPAEYRSRLGWMRHGKVPYEWIMPEKGPSTWQDHLDKHGEGLHHLAFSVDNMDRAIGDWQKAGYAYAMGGAWGKPGERGSGRFAYLDTQAAGGIDIELLWSFR
jgi:methylmalonyl-CoA/ethylmalonyl-CoA epimerase